MLYIRYTDSAIGVANISFSPWMMCFQSVYSPPCVRLFNVGISSCRDIELAISQALLQHDQCAFSLHPCMQFCRKKPWHIRVPIHECCLMVIIFDKSTRTMQEYKVSWHTASGVHEDPLSKYPAALTAQPILLSIHRWCSTYSWDGCFSPKDRCIINKPCTLTTHNHPPSQFRTSRFLLH